MRIFKGKLKVTKYNNRHWGVIQYCSYSFMLKVHVHCITENIVISMTPPEASHGIEIDHMAYLCQSLATLLFLALPVLVKTETSLPNLI